MKPFNFKLIVEPITIENKYDYVDKDSAKIGKVAFPFSKKVDEEQITLKKGDIVYYQYGNEVTIEGNNYVLVNPTNLVCQK